MKNEGEAVAGTAARTSFKISLRIGLAVAAAYLAVALPALTRYPLVFEDEVTLNEPARELALHGRWRSEYFSDSRQAEQFDRHYYWQPPGQALVVAGSYRLFGFGLWQTRLPGVLAAAGCIVALALICGQLAGPPAVALAAGLLALHPQFFRSSTNARMDTLCWLGLLVALGIVLFPARTTRGLWWHVLAGACLGLASLMHVLSISWAIGLNLVLILHRTDWRNWAAFNFACGLPGLGWLAWAWPHRQVWADQFLHHGVSRSATGSLVDRLIAETVRNLIPHAPAPFYLVAVAIGIGLVIPRLRAGRQEVRDVLVLGLTVLVFVTFLMGKVMGEYNVYYFIPLLIPIALGLAQLSGVRPPWRWPVFIALTLCLGWSAARLASPVLIALTVQREARDYTVLARDIGSAIKAGDVVWGTPEAWYAVVQAGAALREASGQPDPARDTAILLPSSRRNEVPGDYQFVRSVGQPLPLVRGRTFSSNDYQLDIWRLRPDRLP